MNHTLGPARAMYKLKIERHCLFIHVLVVTMFMREVLIFIAQRIINTFLAQEGQKLAQILK